MLPELVVSTPPVPDKLEVPSKFKSVIVVCVAPKAIVSAPIVTPLFANEEFAILVNVFFGFYLKDRLGPLLIGGTLISGAIIFFLITNFAVWYGSSYYSNDLAGLITCYTMGLPFFQNTLISSLMYGFSAFYLFEFLAKRYLPS